MNESPVQQTGTEFESAIESLVDALSALPSDPPAFDDRDNHIEDLREAESAAARVWRDVETVLHDHFEVCEIIQSSVDPEKPPTGVQIWAGTPNIESPITSLRVEYQSNGELLVVASYYLCGEEHPFVLGNTETISDVELAAGRIAANLSYSATVRTEQDETPSQVTVGASPGAHQLKREQLDELTENMADPDELLLRLRERPEWLTEEIGQAPSADGRATEIQDTRPDGGNEEVRCIVCGSTPIQGPHLSYDGWRGKLMFCEPCIQRTKEAIEEGNTLLEVIADDLSNHHSRPRKN